MYNWQEKKLGEVCKTTSGGTPSRRHPNYYNGTIPWVKSGELDKGVIHDTEEKITDEAVKNSSTKIFPKGTLLIALYGATIGKLAFLGVDAASNQAVCGIYENDNIDLKYLFNFLLFKRPKLIQQGIGGAQPNISQTILKNLDVPIPKLPEQRAIVKKLESLFSSLDAGVADLKKAQQQLKVYRQAVLKKAFEGEKREQKLINISEAIGGFAFKSTDFVEKGIYQVIRIGNIRPDLIRLNSNPVFVNELNDKTRKYLLKDNDIVISLTGTRNKRDYGFSALVKNENLLLNQRLAAIRFNKDCNPKYYLHYFSTDYFKDDFFSAETGNTGQGNVGMNAIKETLVPFPSLLIQNEIVKQIESRLSVCDSIEQNIKGSLIKAEALRQSILKKAFEGNLLTAQELAQCKQEKDYEPANVLLERIKKINK